MYELQGIAREAEAKCEYYNSQGSKSRIIYYHVKNKHLDLLFLVPESSKDLIPHHEHDKHSVVEENGNKSRMFT